MRLMMQNVVILAVFAVYIFLKLKFFPTDFYVLGQALNVIMMIFLYLVVQPVWLGTFQAQKRMMIYVVAALASILSILWDIEGYQSDSGLFVIDLYLIPVMILTIYTNLRTGLGLTLVLALSDLLIKTFSMSFSLYALLETLMVFATYGLVIFLVSKTVKAREQLNSKHNILVQNSNALIMGATSEGKIDLCNDQMASFLQMERSKVLGQFFWELQKQLDHSEQRRVIELLHDADCHNSEITLSMHDQTYSFFCERYEVNDDGLVGGSSIVLRNITEQKEMEKRLHQLATTDELTGLNNRRHFEQLFLTEIDRSKRYEHPLSLLMLDIDHFKQINDTYGHIVGDEALKEVAHTLNRSLRATDISARLGGEEFCVLLPETNELEARQVAERILEEIRKLEVAADSETVKLTISIGGITRTSDFHYLEMLQSADQALYQAKHNGRDQYVAESAP